MVSLTWLLIGICAAVISANDPMEDPNLFQGDMILTDQQKKDFLEGEANSAVPLAAIRDDLWPTTIPYSIDAKLAGQSGAVSAINDAIADYHKFTCLRFVRHTNEAGYIHFYRGGGCSSPVGYFGKRNRISLSKGCWRKGTVIHEIAHSLGFYHEQSRPDRDEHVIIHWDNISNGMQYNFDKQKSTNIDSMSVPYDYESVMHYGKTAFGRGKLTIETKDKSKQNVIGRRSGFSQLDILQMNLLYKCPGFTRPPPGVKPTGEVTQAPTTKKVTQAPTTKKGCFDSMDGCQDWKNQGLCSQSKWQDFMKKKCPLACGFCRVVATAAPPTTGNCKNTVSHCDYYVNKGYCKREFVPYMKENCPKACNFCSADDSEDIPPQQEGVCMDNIHFCDFYVKKEYCTKLFTKYMKRNCQKSCGFCSAESKLDESQDLVPLPLAQGVCMDNIHFCDFYVKKGYCTKLFTKYMKRNCQKSCGFCSAESKLDESQDLVPLPLAQGVCMDNIHFCDFYVKKGYCTKLFTKYMKRNCQKSCGFCSAESKMDESQDLVPLPLAQGDCINRISHCDYYVKKGYCQKWFTEYMKLNCPRACGFCSGGGVTTPKPSVTNPPVTGSCGRPEIQQGRVIAGVDAKKGAWPWQIVMLRSGRPMCGGSLVSPNWIVTAAHCVYGRPASGFKIRVGEHIIGTMKDGQYRDIQVERVIVHPSYSRRTLDSDIALMKLSRPATFGKYVKPVCLPDHGQHVPEGTECFITGWGKIRHPGNMHHTLQQGKMPVVSNKVCSSLNTKNMKIPITDKMVCAGHGGTTRVGGCHGDSGGPFVCKTGANGQWVLHGAVSWGNGRCDASRGYTVFARVASFRSWINEQMSRY